MGVLTLTPTGVREYRGTYQGVGTDELTALQDSSDATYVNLKTTYPGYPNSLWGASYIIYFGGQAIPSGARVTKVYHKVRAKKTTSLARTARIRIMEITQWRAAISTANLGTDYQHAASYSLSQNATTITGPAITKRPDGTAITAATVGRLGIELYQFFHSTVEWLKANIIVEYDNQPTVSNIDQDGDTQSIASPLISWTYNDDTQPQYAYRVTISTGGVTVYDSGKVYTGEGFHQVQQHLPDAVYTVQVRVAQEWHGPGGEFWSPWRSATVTIKSQIPAPPSVNATIDPAHGRVTIDVLSNLNKLTYESAHFDLRAAPAVKTLANCTLDETAIGTHSGNYAGRVTLTAANPSVTLDRSRQPATAGVVYKASAYVQAQTGSNLTATVTVRYLDASYSLLSATAGTGVAESTGVWVQPSASATAPVGTAFVDMVIAWSGGTTSNVHLLDDAEIRVSNANFADPTLIGGTSRGGMLNRIGNLFSYEDFSGEMTPVNWVDYDPTSTDVSVSADFAFHGEASILAASNGGGNGGITNALLYEVIPGEQYYLRAFYLSGATSRNFRIGAIMYDQDQINLNNDQFPAAAAASVVGKWTEMSGVITIPAGVAFMQVYFFYVSAVDGELHYFDALMCVNVTATGGLDPGLLIGNGNYQGPYTTIEYSEDAGVTWSELVTINATAEASTYYDAETVQGISRRYRAYNWKIIDGQTFLSPKSATTADVSVTITQTWMHIETDPAGSLYGFLYWVGQRTDSPDMGGQLNDYVGREYPMVSFGEIKRRTVQTGVGLPNTADQVAFEKFATSKARIMYRDRTGRRAWVTIGNVSIVDRSLGEKVATFDVTYIGNQP